MSEFLGLVSFILLFVLVGATESLRQKLNKIQRTLDALAAHMNFQPTPTPPAEVLGLLQAGRKIEAIKAYRAATGAGLAEAKEAVETLESQMGAAVNKPFDV
jgi:ribosomal protein L7/L12